MQIITQLPLPKFHMKKTGYMVGREYRKVTELIMDMVVRRCKDGIITPMVSNSSVLFRSHI
jgi:hypothetical protein